MYALLGDATIPTLLLSYPSQPRPLVTRRCRCGPVPSYITSTLYLDLGIQNARIPLQLPTWRFEPSSNGWPFPILCSLQTTSCGVQLAACSSQLQLSAQAPSSKLPSPRHTQFVLRERGIVLWYAPGSLTRLGGAVDHAFSGATAWLCMHAASTCCTIIAHCAGAGACAALSSAAPMFPLPFPGASVSANSCPSNNLGWLAEDDMQ